MDRIEIYGTEFEVYQKIQKLGFNNNDDIDRMIMFLKRNSDLLSVDEKIEKENCYSGIATWSIWINNAK